MTEHENMERHLIPHCTPIIPQKKRCNTFPIELNGFCPVFPNTPPLKDYLPSEECPETCTYDTEMGILDWQKFACTALNE